MNASNTIILLMKNRKYWASQFTELPANPFQRTRLNLQRLDITNCDFTKNTAHDVYLNIPGKHLYKSKLKTRLDLLTSGRVL